MSRYVLETEGPNPTMRHGADAGQIVSFGQDTPGSASTTGSTIWNLAVWFAGMVAASYIGTRYAMKKARE